jgi:hypothetical protein
VSETRKNLGLGALALIPVVCCLGIPLVAAAGVVAAAWAGGIALGVVVLAAVAILLSGRPPALRPGSRAGAVDDAEPAVSNAGCCAHAPSEHPREPVSGDRPLVEILYFDGCPNHHPAVALVQRVSRELGIEPNLRLVNVPDQEAARRLRFLSSPTIRVGGVDVDPQSGERDDYALSCRIFQTERGMSGQPDEAWVREALLREAGSGG